VQEFVYDKGLLYEREIGMRMERLYSLRAYRSQTDIMGLYLEISECRMIEDTLLGYRTHSASDSGAHSTDASQLSTEYFIAGSRHVLWILMQWLFATLKPLQVFGGMGKNACLLGLCY
jgi:hypothetical protein